LLAVVALVVVAVALAACGGGATPQPTATVTVTPSTSALPAVSPSGSAASSSAATTGVKVYLLRPIGGAQPVHAPFVATARRAVPQTVAVATAAVNALLAGPTARERAIGMSTDIPTGTTLRRLTIAGGVATVDLSSAFTAAGTKSAMTARLAQVVYTLTQFPSVGKGVLFKIDGAAVTSFGATGIDLTHPQRRAGYESVTPPIFVDDPAPFDTVSGTLRVSGTADVFEATFRARLVAGALHRTLTVMATSGSGTRGAFAFSVALPAGSTTGKLTVWDASAENGAALHTVTVPLIVR
jgi:spore germination protein GerM